MKIAVDVRVVLGRKTGDRTYALNLLRGLRKLFDAGEWPRDWSLHVLLDRPDAEGVLRFLEGSPAFKIVAVPSPRGNSRLWTLVSLPNYARRERLDLVHVQYLAPPVLPCPFVTTIHDVVWRAMPQTFPRQDRLVMNALMPQTVRRAAHIITGSESSRRGIARYLPTRKRKIAVMPYAVEPRYFEPVAPERVESVRHKYGLANAPYVLSVGVLQPRKNVPRLIEAFKRVKARRPDLPHNLAIVGKHGWGEEQLATGNAQSNIISTGYVSDDELPALYAGADLFAYPSLYEGFGYPVLEAMACGCPVLTSNVSSLPEVAGDAAILCEPRSVESIAEGLERLLHGILLREELRRKGRERAALFTTRVQAEETFQVYRETLIAKNRLEH